ncbi:Non-reducing polyketide synthase sor2 [Bienertia sinuspersici]
MLSQEVQACEYEDVHMMWEMLKKSKTQEAVRSPSHKYLKNTPLRNALS